MPEILPKAELTRIAHSRKSAPSTRSSSPGPSSYISGSPAAQPGALSPAPPAHYLRNKSQSEETNDASIKLLRKRSELYDRDRDRERSRRSVVTRAPPSSSPADSLLFQQDLFRPAYLEPSSFTRGRTRLHDGTGVGSPLISSSPSFSPSKQWAFLGTDPMSPPPLPSSTMKSALVREKERDSMPLLRPTQTNSTDDSWLGEPSRSLGSSDPHFSSSMDSHSNSAQGSRRGSATAAPLSLRRYHRARSTGSDSSISISTSSNTSSSFFPPSLEPCSSYSPPVQSTLLPHFVTNGPQIVSPASPISGTPHDGEPHSPMSFAPNSPPHSAPGALYDVQKRRRAYAIDHFTSYTETLPYHHRGSGHHNHRDRERSSTHGHGSGAAAEGTRSGPARSADREMESESETLHSTRSVPNLRGEMIWGRDSLENDMELQRELREKEYEDRSDSPAMMAQLDDAPRRKSSCRIMGSIKSMLTSKSSAPTKR